MLYETPPVFRRSLVLLPSHLVAGQHAPQRFGGRRCRQVQHTVGAPRLATNRPLRLTCRAESVNAPHTEHGTPKNVYFCVCVFLLCMLLVSF
jgi:hypothetical protein